jgi:hypothetical protein
MRTAAFVLPKDADIMPSSSACNRMQLIRICLYGMHRLLWHTVGASAVDKGTGRLHARQVLQLAEWMKELGQGGRDELEELFQVR